MKNNVLLACILGSAAAVAPVAFSAELRKGNPVTIPDLDLTLRPIPAGTFTMGSPVEEKGRNFTEGPQTVVTLRNFWLGKTEVTRAQWQIVTGQSPYPARDSALPIETITWDDAMDFCRKLTERERKAGRLPPNYIYTLPTEAQWEYACRAGTHGPYAGNLESMAWYSENSGRARHEVAQKQPNAWGLYDMHGNVWEWCFDWLGDKLPGGSVSDPVGDPAAATRGARGGSSYDVPGGPRSAVRASVKLSMRNFQFGFRLALTSLP